MASHYATTLLEDQLQALGIRILVADDFRGVLGSRGDHDDNPEFRTAAKERPKPNIARIHILGRRVDFQYAGALCDTIAQFVQCIGAPGINSGRFERIDGLPRTNLARLNLDGSLDRSFVPPPVLARDFEQGTSWLGVQRDGKILVAGWSSNGIVRLDPDGGMDSQFQPPTLDAPSSGLVGVRGAATQADGMILLFGQFGGVSNEIRDGIARLDANGFLDRSFNPRLQSGGSVGNLETLVIQDDGKILIGGFFNSVNETPRPGGLARLNPDGSLDPTFA